MAIRIVTDSTCDLPLSYIRSHNLHVIGFPIRLGDEEYTISPDETLPGNISYAEFAKKLSEGATVSTSQISIDTYQSVFAEIFATGDDILCLCFSSGLTGTLNSARLASEELTEQYPERRIAFVDTLSASLGEGLVVMQAVEALESGANDLDALAEHVRSTIPNAIHWFTVNDLHYLAKGGRLSGSAAFVGTLLNVKPILDVSLEGKLVPREKVQGRKKVFKTMIEKAASQAGTNPVHIGHTACPEDADFVRKALEDKGVQVGFIEPITPVIASHTGLGVIALFYMSDTTRNA